MGQPRSESIDEFVKHELAVQQRILVLRDFHGQIVKELRLDPAERLRCLAAGTGKSRIGLFPLPQFELALLLRSTHMVHEFLQQLVLT